MARFSIHSGPPADANRYKTLAWVKDASNPSYVIVKAWRGKALKPFANYYFKSEERADKFIAECQQDEDARLAFRDKLKAERDERAAVADREMQVGTILHYSWGYDQTNCEYYEIIEKRGRTVTIREIASRIVPNSEGFMSESRCPSPGEYIGPAIRKRISDGSLRMDFGCASVVHPWEKHYSSHYA